MCWRDKSELLEMSASPATTGMLWTACMFLIGDGIEAASRLLGDFVSERGGSAALKTPAGEVSMASGRVGGFE